MIVSSNLIEQGRLVINATHALATSRIWMMDSVMMRSKAMCKSCWTIFKMLFWISRKLIRTRRIRIVFNTWIFLASTVRSRQAALESPLISEVVIIKIWEKCRRVQRIAIIRITTWDRLQCWAVRLHPTSRMTTPITSGLLTMGKLLFPLRVKSSRFEV